jgi:hypothetical protein
MSHVDDPLALTRHIILEELLPPFPPYPPEQPEDGESNPNLNDPRLSLIHPGDWDKFSFIRNASNSPRQPMGMWSYNKVTHSQIMGFGRINGSMSQLGHLGDKALSTTVSSIHIDSSLPHPSSDSPSRSLPTTSPGSNLKLLWRILIFGRVMTVMNWLTYGSIRP